MSERTENTRSGLAAIVAVRVKAMRRPERVPVMNRAAQPVCQPAGRGPTNLDISAAYRAPSEGPTEDARCAAPLVGRDCHRLRPAQPGRQIPNRQRDADCRPDRPEAG